MKTRKRKPRSKIRGQTLSIRLDDELKQRLVEARKREDLSFGALVRVALRKAYDW